MKEKIIISVCLLALSNISFADNVKGVMKSTAQLAGTCSISATLVSFGEWKPNLPTVYANSASQKATNIISVLCSNKLPFTIKGPHNLEKPGAVGQFMTGATSSDQLVYNVYTKDDFSANTWFADGKPQVNGTTTFITSTGTGVTQNIPLYFYLYSAAVWPKTWVRPDVYTDNYVLTLTY